MNRKKIAAGLLAVMVLVPGVVQAGNMSSGKDANQSILLLSEDAHTELSYSENPEDLSQNSGEEQEVPATSPEVTPDVTPEATPEPTPTVAPEVTPEPTPTVTPEVTPTVTPEATPEPTPAVTPEIPSEGLPEITPEVTPEISPETTPETTPEPTPELPTNENLIANQQIVIPPQVEPDFRLTKVDMVEAFSQGKHNIYEERNLNSDIVGQLPRNGVCYILEDCQDGWYFVESGKVRGFVKEKWLMLNEEAEALRAQLEEENEEILCAVIKKDPLENKSLLYTMTSVYDVVVEKVYAFCDADLLNIREGKSTDNRILGTLSNGQICYVLEDEDEEWSFIESSDVRGFVKKEYLLTGWEAEKRAKEVLELNQEPEDVFGTAQEIINFSENAVCYYTLTSVKEANQTSQMRTALLNYAVQFAGNPYVWGGSDPVHGADCSGFTQHVYGQFGVSLPRTSAAQSQYGMKIPVSEAAPGDLIFYAKNGIVYHVVIYLGDGRTIEAANSRLGITSLNVNYANAVWATRVLQ